MGACRRDKRPGITSLVAVITWRETGAVTARNSRLTASSIWPGKEFSGKDDIRGLKDELGALKSNLIGIGILGVAALLLVMWDRLTTLTGGRDGNRET